MSSIDKLLKLCNGQHLTDVRYKNRTVLASSKHKLATSVLLLTNLYTMKTPYPDQLGPRVVRINQDKLKLIIRDKSGYEKYKKEKSQVIEHYYIFAYVCKKK